MNMAALAVAWDIACRMPPSSAPPLWSGADGVERQREHQEEVADLGESRVGDQELQSLLPQRDDAAERGSPPRPARRAAAPPAMPATTGITSNQSRMTMKNDPFTTSADNTALAAGRRAGMGRRQPEMQREERGLGEQAGRHQRGRDRAARARRDPLGQQDDIERAVGAVEQRRADQIEHRAKQREDQIAQRGRKGLRAAIQADQRHRSERQQLQRNVQVKRSPPRKTVFNAPQIARSKIQNANGRRASTDPAGVRKSARAKSPTAQITTAVITIIDHRKPIRAQRHTQRRRPPAEQIDERRRLLQHQRRRSLLRSRSQAP